VLPCWSTKYVVAPSDTLLLKYSWELQHLRSGDNLSKSRLSPGRAARRQFFTFGKRFRIDDAFSQLVQLLISRPFFIKRLLEKVSEPKSQGAERVNLIHRLWHDDRLSRRVQHFCEPAGILVPVSSGPRQTVLED
jgi:hypothetical protein